MDQSYTAYCRSLSRSMHPSATFPVIVIVPPAARVTENAKDEVVPVTAGVGEFFRVHQKAPPPHGHSPENVIVICSVADVLSHAVRTNDALAPTVPGAHFGENTPAWATADVKMTGAVQPTAPAVTARRSRSRRPVTDEGFSADISLTLTPDFDASERSATAVALLPAGVVGAPARSVAVARAAGQRLSRAGGPLEPGVGIEPTTS